MQLKFLTVSIIWLATVAIAFRINNDIRHHHIPYHHDHTLSKRFQKCSQGYYAVIYNNNNRYRAIKNFRVHPLHLIPIRSLNYEVPLLSFLNEDDRLTGPMMDHDGIIILNNTSYELSFMEENDIGILAQFIVCIFGGDAINLSQNLTSVERLILTPAVDVVNGYSSLVAFAEVYAGLRSRLSYRFQSNDVMDVISPPNLHGVSREEQIRSISSTSIVIVLASTESKSNEGSTTGSNRKNPIIIASVELRLQPCDAKIPFTLPWIDRIERKLFSSNRLKQPPQNDDLQPYLSNLCVDEMYRGRGIGKLLVHCVETIANTHWGYHQMYLHVDLENVAAVQLYQKQGYTDVGRRWNPFWAGKAADIGYFVKNIQ